MSWQLIFSRKVDFLQVHNKLEVSKTFTSFSGTSTVLCEQICSQDYQCAIFIKATTIQSINQFSCQGIEPTRSTIEFQCLWSWAVFSTSLGSRPSHSWYAEQHQPSKCGAPLGLNHFDPSASSWWIKMVNGLSWVIRWKVQQIFKLV